MENVPAKALSELLNLLNINDAEINAQVKVVGDDPVVPSRHRLGAATAAALAAQGAAIAQIWKMRTGRSQSVSVHVDDAVYALNSVRYLRQNGFPIGAQLLPMEPVNGNFKTRDGRLVALLGPRLRLRNDLLKVLDCANTKEAVTAAVAQRDAEEIEEACWEERVVGVMVRTTEEWRAHPQGQILKDVPVIEIEKIGDSKPEPFSEGAVRPLSDVRVLDFAHLLAGPGVGRTMAEQGADVLRIATPKEPDQLTNTIDTGFGKRAAYLDLNTVEHVDRLKELVSEADVFVQSYSPGALARRGFGPEDLAAIRPGIIYVSVNAWGHEGPWAMNRGFDPESQAVVGIAAAEGSLEEPKRLPTLLLNDYLSAFLGTAGVLSAMLRRAEEGGSYHVKLSLARTGMWVQDLGLVSEEALAKPPVIAPPRMASMPTPYGQFDHLMPATRFSETTAYWDKPTVPPGASLAQWLPR